LGGTCSQGGGVRLEMEEKMRKILVALDGSPASEKALVEAVKQAQSGNVAVAAVAVLDRSGDPRLEQLAAGVKSKLRERLEGTLQAAANFARSRGVRLTPLLREGHPAEAIVSCAEQESADLVVLGSSSVAGRQGLGGTADRVSSHSPCSVMLVK
jgi:nucleotide-binding universal stress UspA family protein